MIHKLHMLLKNILVLFFLIFPNISFADSVESEKDRETKESETVVLPQGNGPIIELTIDGTINPVSSDYIQKGLLHASALDGRLVVIKMNTPGGLLPSMQTIVEAILDSKVPVAIYVTPSGGGAISAGVFITLAGHIAVMSPGTTIGAAAPVQSGGADIGEDMKGKVQNFAASMVKSIAEQRGRNVEWAEKAVRESVALTDNEALEQKVIDFIAPNMGVLLREAENFECLTPQGKIILTDLVDHPRESFDMSTQQKIINAISDPNIAALLGLGAMGGILAEFYNPGLIFPGLFGVICLILSLVAMQVIPINAGGILLLLLGGVLMTVEFLIPSFGIFGIAGVVCLVLGSIYAIDTSMVWAVDGFAVDTVLVGSIAGFLGLTLLLIVYLAVSSKTRKVTTGKEGLIGMKAKVTREFQSSDTDSYPRGSVRVMGEIWSAELISGDLPLLVGSEVVINDIDGIVLRVVK